MITYGVCEATSGKTRRCNVVCKKQDPKHMSTAGYNYIKIIYIYRESLENNTEK